MVPLIQVLQLHGVFHTPLVSSFPKQKNKFISSSFTISQISAIARIRSSLAFATHKFFNEHGFMYIHTPLITTSDAEGAGELFQVTTLLNKLSGSQEAPPTEEELEAAEAAVAAKGDQVRALKEKKEKSKVKVAVSELTALKEKLEELKKRYRVVGGLLRKDDGGVDYVDDFFGRQAFLTVSGQLQVRQFYCPGVFPMH